MPVQWSIPVFQSTDYTLPAIAIKFTRNSLVTYGGSKAGFPNKSTIFGTPKPLLILVGYMHTESKNADFCNIHIMMRYILRLLSLEH